MSKLLLLFQVVVIICIYNGKALNWNSSKKPSGINRYVKSLHSNFHSFKLFLAFLDPLELSLTSETWPFLQLQNLHGNILTKRGNWSRKSMNHRKIGQKFHSMSSCFSRPSLHFLHGVAECF